MNDIPAEAIEAAAKVLHADYSSEYDYPAWEQCDQSGFLTQARRVLEAAAPILMAAGRDQAMSGAVEWGVRYPDGHTVRVIDEQTARVWAADHEPYGTRPGPPVAVSRWRTEWAEPEQGGQQ